VWGGLVGGEPDVGEGVASVKGDAPMFDGVDVIGIGGAGLGRAVDEFGRDVAKGCGGANLILAEVIEEGDVPAGSDPFVVHGPGGGVAGFDGVVDARGEDSDVFFDFGHAGRPGGEFFLVGTQWVARRGAIDRIVGFWIDE